MVCVPHSCVYPTRVCTPTRVYPRENAQCARVVVVVVVVVVVTRTRRLANAPPRDGGQHARTSSRTSPAPIRTSRTHRSTRASSTTGAIPILGLASHDHRRQAPVGGSCSPVDDDATTRRPTRVRARVTDVWVRAFARARRCIARCSIRCVGDHARARDADATGATVGAGDANG